MQVKKELKTLANSEKAKVLQRFFKTGKGEYGECDIFLGITVPDSRKLAIKYSYIDLASIENLLKSKVHEERLVGLLILVHRYNKGSEKTRIFDFYLRNIKYVNNWDLVDLTADKIVGIHLIDKDKKLLYNLVKSSNVWERRISIISTFAFIKRNKFDDTLKISKILMDDDHDLIQKAIGWMLREVGKRDIKTEENFLKKYYKKMSRTALRYSVERFPEKKRLAYLKGKI